MQENYASKDAAKQALSAGNFPQSVKDFAAGAVDDVVLPEGWNGVSVHVAASDSSILVHVHATP